MKQVLKIIIGMGILGLMTGFVMQNQWMLNKEFSFSYYTRSTPHINFLVLLLGTAITGSLLSSLIMLVNQMSLKLIIRKKDKTIAKMEKELNSLRNLPIIEDDKILDDS